MCCTDKHVIFLCKNPTKQPRKFLRVMKQKVAILTPCFSLPLFMLGSQPGTLFASFLLANPSLIHPSPPPGRPSSSPLDWTGCSISGSHSTLLRLLSYFAGILFLFMQRNCVLFQRVDCLLYSCVPAAQHGVQNTVSSQSLFVLNG